VPAWIPYTLVRVGLFAVSLVVLMLLGLEVWLAALIAAAIGFLVSYIFFRGMRARVAGELAASRASTDKRPDEVVEDRD
jgi:ABC-type bacteriocin/lantibiotic exporter with double-glycine peptidase domain